MTKLLLWILVILCVLMVIALLFLRDLTKDKIELRKMSIEDKFSVILADINAVLLNGEGEILPHKEPRTVNMCNDHIMVGLWYGTGHLTISMVYEYGGREVVIEKTYGNVRKISEDDQHTIAKNYFIPLACEKMRQHEENVILEQRWRNF